MVGVGLNITEVSTMVVDELLVSEIFGAMATLGLLILLITAIWIFARGGANAIGVFLTGWVALLLYMSGAYGYEAIISSWVGVITIVLIVSIFVYAIIKVFKGG